MDYLPEKMDEADRKAGEEMTIPAVAVAVCYSRQNAPREEVDEAFGFGHCCQ